MVETVSFTQMKDGTAADYALLERLEEEFARALPTRILERLRLLETSLAGYRVTRLEHSLQSATRALRDGADTDWIVAALVHDIGDDLAPYNHDSVAAAVLQPYVREQCSWVVRHHGLFQTVYYAHHSGGDRHARDEHENHPWYRDAIDFCERWDQASFDPDYASEPLEHFEPMVEEVFTRPAWSPDHLRPGCSEPLYRSPDA